MRAKRNSVIGAKCAALRLRGDHPLPAKGGQNRPSPAYPSLCPGQKRPKPDTLACFVPHPGNPCPIRIIRGRARTAKNRKPGRKAGNAARPARIPPRAAAGVHRVHAVHRVHGGAVAEGRPNPDRSGHARLPWEPACRGVGDIYTTRLALAARGKRFLARREMEGEAWLRYDCSDPKLLR